MVIFALLASMGISNNYLLLVMLLLALAGSIVCVRFAPAAIARTGKNDPGEVVADEFAGQAVTFMFAGFIPINYICTTAIAGFLLFRVFDVFKPWPIRRLEKFPKGWGILADDLLAGVYAGIALFLCLKFGAIDYISQLCGAGRESLNIFSATILGIVQGLTEFLPVSSSGHLVLFGNIFHLDTEKPEMLLFDLAVHIGTLVSIFIVFYKSIVAFLKNMAGFRKYGTRPIEIYKRSPSIHIFVLAIITTGVTGVLGMSFKHYFAAAFGSLRTVALMWIVTGTFLLITDFRKKTRMGIREFGVMAAIIIGLAQTVAILPGVSRSGATICAAILIGLHRRWAVEYSFLIAIPAILAATLVESLENFSKIGSAALPMSAIIVGSVAAAIAGVLALKILIKISRAANLKFFAFYCYILACCVFFLLR
jgi:undecaprenyl-diphosphatase